MDETKIDQAAMGRLAKALSFICGPEHATTVALKKAAESGSDQDAKRARRGTADGDTGATDGSASAEPTSTERRPHIEPSR